jgi:hypothetical protein
VRDADDRSSSALDALVELYRRSPPRSELRREIESWAENALVAARTVAERSEPLGDDVSEGELERALAAAEPELAEMITPDSIAERAAHEADAAPDEHPLASSGAFATRTMAELLERQGDARGAARIRAALGAADEPTALEGANTAAIAALERWLENLRRLQG